MSVYLGENYGWSDSTTSSYSRSKYASQSNIRRMSGDITAGYSYEIEKIKKYADMGNMDKAIEKYHSLFDKVKATASDYNYTLSDSQVKSILDNAYYNITKEGVTDGLTKGTEDPFTTGLIQTILPIAGFFTHTNSRNEILSKLDKEEVSNDARAAENWGRGVGIAANTAIPIVVGLLTTHPVIGFTVGAINAVLAVIQSVVHNSKDAA